MITNDGQVEMVDDESPDVGLDEKVGPFSTRMWQPPKYERTKTETADRTNEPQKKWFALVVDFPMVTGCKYQSKNWVALEYIGVTRERPATRGEHCLKNGLEAIVSTLF